MQHEYWVYILSNKNNNVFYVGVTRSIDRRYFQHLLKKHPNSFTARYNLNKLVYMEFHKYIKNAIFREKCIKKWNREWKINLIKELNPRFTDLLLDLRDIVANMY